MEMTNVANCAICGTTEQLLRCAKCKTVYYCSTAHQHRDWPLHKQKCKALAKQKSNNKMQHLQLAVAAASLGNSVKKLTNGYHENELTNSINGQQYVVMGTNENEILNTQAETCSASDNFRLQHHHPHHNQIHIEQLNVDRASNVANVLEDDTSNTVDNGFHAASSPQLFLQQPAVQQLPATPQFTPQFSNYANNQYEKSSSYQIGRVDENHIGNVK